VRKVVMIGPPAARARTGFSRGPLGPLFVASVALTESCQLF
jgi:hypothetical protein